MVPPLRHTYFKMSEKIRILPTIFLRRSGLSRYLNYKTKTRLNKTQITVPIHAGALEKLLTLKKGFKSSLLELLKDKADTSCFVDIGANYGQSMIEAYAFNNTVRYYGFEPNPEAFVSLKKVAETNNINACIFPWACSSTTEPIELFASSDLDAAATTVPHIRPDTYQNTLGMWVGAYPLDSFRGHLSLKDRFVLKIDVEGAENEVFQGSLDTIGKHRPFIFCEVLHAHRETEIEHNNKRKLQLETILRELRYSIYLCELDPSEHERFLGIRKIEGLPKDQVWSNSPHTCDYLFVPNELDGFS
jgi:FkbM family methyltransferase